MEAMGDVYFDEEWESVSKIFSSHENGDFMLQLQNDNEFLNNHLQENGGLDILTGDCFLSSGSNSAMINTNLPQSQPNDVMMMTTFENNNPLDVPTFYPDDAYKIMRADTCEGNLTAIVDSHKELQQLKRNIDTVDQEGHTINGSPQNPNKKPRVSRHKNKKTALPKPNKNPGNGDEDPEEENARTSSCTSSNHTDHELTKASNELNIEMQNTDSKSKTRATRGAATDPQSLYARRRRERINERLRILQNLIPNGTKVDISTMLEQAVHYVKFLQLQIKLLSSDDLWMYAPIAYNGMDIELFQKMLPTL